MADSLTRIYQEDILTGEDKLELLKNLAFNELNDPDLSLAYAEELIRLSELEKNSYYLFSGYLQKGEHYKMSGDLNLALEIYFKAVNLAIDLDRIGDEGVVSGTRGDDHGNLAVLAKTDPEHDSRRDEIQNLHQRLGNQPGIAGDEFEFLVNKRAERRIAAKHPFGCASARGSFRDTECQHDNPAKLYRTTPGSHRKKSGRNREEQEHGIALSCHRMCEEPPRGACSRRMVCQIRKLVKINRNKVNLQISLID